MLDALVALCLSLVAFGHFILFSWIMVLMVSWNLVTIYIEDIVGLSAEYIFM